jgi:hypothetical protein
MFVLKLSVDEVFFRHYSCVAGHGSGIRVVTVWKVEDYMEGRGAKRFYRFTY